MLAWLGAGLFNDGKWATFSDVQGRRRATSPRATNATIRRHLRRRLRRIGDVMATSPGGCGDVDVYLGVTCSKISLLSRMTNKDVVADFRPNVTLRSQM